MKTHYEILGVTPDSDDKTIKKAYRQLAKKYHPDHNHAADAADRFKEVQKAYETIGTAEGRAAYNAELEKKKNAGPAGMGQRGGMGGGAAAGAKSRADGKRTPGSAADINFADMSSAFERMFGFNPKTKDITDESKLNKNMNVKKDPFNSDKIFNSFFGFKR